MTVGEVAERKKVTKQNVLYWISKGCPSKKVREKGRRWQYDLKIGKVNEWLKKKGLE